MADIPPPPDGFKVEAAIPPPPDGFKVESRPMTLAENVSYGLNMDLPFLSQLGRGVGAIGDLEQKGAEGLAGGVAERTAKAGFPKLATAAGVAAGALPDMASTAPQLISRLIPTKVKDVALMTIAEGAGALLGKAAPAIAKFFAETPISEHLQPAIMSAKLLGVPLSLDEIQNTKAFSALGAILRKYGGTSDAMDAFDQSRAKALSDARAKIQDALEPARGRTAIGGEALGDIQTKLTGQQGARDQNYSDLRSKMTSPYPAPALPEARAGAAKAAVGANRSAALVDRSQLYGNAENALYDMGVTPATRLDAGPLQAVAGGVLKELGGKPLPGSGAQLAYNMADQLSKAGDAADAEALSKIRPEFLDLVRKNPELAKQLPPDVQKALADKGTVSLGQLQSYIKQLGDAAEEKGRFTLGPGQGDYNNTGRLLLRLKAAAEQVERDFYGQQGGEAAARYQVADAFHGEYARTFRSKEVLKLINNDPTVVQDVLRRGNVDEMRTVARALGPSGQAVLKRELFDHVFGPPTVPVQGADGKMIEQVNIPDVVDVATRLADFGPAVRELLSPKEQAQWLKFSKTGEEPDFLLSAYEDRMRQLVKSGRPMDVMNAILGGDVLTARAAKRYVSPSTFKAVQAQLADEILTPKPGASEQSANGILGRLGKYSDRYLNTVFDDPSIVRGMRTVGEAQRLLPGYGDLAKMPASPGKSALKLVSTSGGALGSIGAGIGYLSGGKEGAAIGAIVGGSFAIGAPELAKLYTTEGGQRIMTTLFRMPETDPRLPTLLKTLARMGYLYHRADAQRDNARISPAAP